jgi:hypothetical protein
MKGKNKVEVEMGSGRLLQVRAPVHHRKQIRKENTMAMAFLFKKQVLCDECYREVVDFEIHAGREKELPPRKMIAARECDRCHAILEPEEEL